MLPHTSGLFTEAKPSANLLILVLSLTLSENPSLKRERSTEGILRETDGITVAVDEASILKAQRDLAEKGSSPNASAVRFAALNKLQKEVNMKRAVVVAVLTGSEG